MVAAILGVLLLLLLIKVRLHPPFPQPQQGEYDAAELLFREALDSCKRNNLASLVSAQGKYGEAAEPLYREADDIIKHTQAHSG